MPGQELIAKRSGHLCPHSTGNPLKTIVGCWGFLNFEPHRQNLVLAGSCVKAQYGDVSSKGWMNWKPSTGIALHPKSFVNWTVTSCGVSVKSLVHRVWKEMLFVHWANQYIFYYIGHFKLTKSEKDSDSDEWKRKTWEFKQRQRAIFCQKIWQVFGRYRWTSEKWIMLQVWFETVEIYCYSSWIHPLFLKTTNIL